MVEIKNLKAGYGKTEILSGISLTAEFGEITTVIGANGCGKSTLLKAIVGLIPALSGSIRVEGVLVDNMSSIERAKKISYLPQGKNIPDISAGRMVLHGRFPYLSYPRKYRKVDFAVVENVMEQMGILHLADKPLSALSGGMRQKVYIAAALAQETDVIIMDEPTTYLDIGRQLSLSKTVKGLSEKGKTIIMVLHDILLALKISDKIAVMENGIISVCGTPREIMESGITEKIYGVSIKSIDDGCGTQYYYDI